MRSMTVCERCLEIFDNRHTFFEHVRLFHGDMPREDVRSYEISLEQLRDFGIIPRTLNWADETEESDLEILDMKIEPED